jgi:uncharacterized protein (TIGR02594 family)
MSSVNDTINNFISVAERFHGVREGTPQHSIILALYNSSKPAGEYQMGPNDPWCAAFVGAVSGGCGLQNIVPVSASCARMKDKLFEYGAKRVSKPAPGDIAFFDWDGDGHPIEHVGIVTKVDENGWVTTIEGNKSDMVGYRQFNNLMVVFVRPNWEGVAVQATETPITPVKDYYAALTWDEKNEIKTFPMLKLGSNGIYVKILQDFLGVNQDGKFFQEVEVALKKYQEEKRLEVDGICGRQTWSSFFA